MLKRAVEKSPEYAFLIFILVCVWNAYVLDILSQYYFNGEFPDYNYTWFGIGTFSIAVIVIEFYKSGKE